jgi:hypothetical protein
MSEPRQDGAPPPVPTPSSEQQLEEARSKEDKTTPDEAVIKLDDDLRPGKENPI